MPDADVDLYSCPRCGPYLLSGLLRSYLPSKSASDRIALSRFLRVHFDRSGRHYDQPLIPGNFEALAKEGTPPVGALAQMDELLRLVAARTNHLGDQTEPEAGLVWAARLGLPSEAAFDKLANAGRDRGLLDHAVRLEPTRGHALGLTLAGWERAERAGTLPANQPPRKPVSPMEPPPAGSGFVLDFDEEGMPIAVPAGAGRAPAAVAAPASPAVANARSPRAFISYSWDSEPHKAWVKDLATRLRGDGVDVILDRWHVAVGDQLPEFMERSVRESDFVVLICTPNFKAKADGRRGGVGYEGHIITAEVFGGADPRKFVPVHRAGMWDEAAPSWLKGKLFADLRGDPVSEEEYARLLEHLHDDREAPPPVGNYIKRHRTPDPR